MKKLILFLLLFFTFFSFAQEEKYKDFFVSCDTMKNYSTNCYALKLKNLIYQIYKDDLKISDSLLEFNNTYIEMLIEKEDSGYFNLISFFPECKSLEKKIQKELQKLPKFEVKKDKNNSKSFTIILKLNNDFKEGEITPIKKDQEIVCPTFPDCSNDKTMICLEKSMLNFVRKNFKYPELAIEKNYQGRVYCYLIFDKNGEIESVFSSGAHFILNTASARLFLKTPKCEPATLNGKPVRVSYSLPLSYRIQ